MIDIYPLTITKDRYTGAYSHGEYLAWNLRIWDIPRDPFEDDVTCMMFWEMNKLLVGIGATPETAVNDLKNKLYRKAMELRRKYGGSLSDYIKAIEVCDCDNEIEIWDFLIRLHPNMVKF